MRLTGNQVAVICLCAVLCFFCAETGYLIGRKQSTTVKKEVTVQMSDDRKIVAGWEGASDLSEITFVQQMPDSEGREWVGECQLQRVTDNQGK